MVLHGGGSIQIDLGAGALFSFLNIIALRHRARP
jgi:hypothetical protein